MSLDLCLKQLYVVGYTLKFFFACSIYVCSCTTPSFSSPAISSRANSAIPLIPLLLTLWSVRS